MDYENKTTPPEFKVVAPNNRNNQNNVLGNSGYCWR